jgi:hypothetical protein
LRRELEGPGEHQREGESEDHQRNDNLEDPCRCFEQREHERGDLDHHPADDAIGNADLYDIAALQFGPGMRRSASVRCLCAGAASG